MVVSHKTSKQACIRQGTQKACTHCRSCGGAEGCTRSVAAMLGEMLRAVASLSCSSHRELEVSSLLWPLASSWRMAI